MQYPYRYVPHRTHNHLPCAHSSMHDKSQALSDPAQGKQNKMIIADLCCPGTLTGCPQGMMRILKGN